MVECCKSNTVRKPWEALITWLPHKALKAISSPRCLPQSSTCVPNKRGFPTGPELARAEPSWSYDWDSVTGLWKDRLEWQCGKMRTCQHTGVFCCHRLRAGWIWRDSNKTTATLWSCRLSRTGDRCDWRAPRLLSTSAPARIMNQVNTWCSTTFRWIALKFFADIFCFQKINLLETKNDFDCSNNMRLIFVSVKGKVSRDILVLLRVYFLITFPLSPS